MLNSKANELVSETADLLSKLDAFTGVPLCDDASRQLMRHIAALSFYNANHRLWKRAFADLESLRDEASDKLEAWQQNRDSRQ